MNESVFNKHDVIKALGRFPDRINPPERMKSNKWKCSKCQQLYVYQGEPNVIPSPCGKCGSVFFEVVKD